jgi:hypothetical protein
MNEFHFYAGGIDRKFPKRKLTLDKVVELLKSEQYRPQVEEIRSKETKKEQDELKVLMDYVTFSGLFKFRHADQIKQHSGLIVLDVDKLTTVEDTFLQLSTDPYFRLMFISPSGKGLKIVVAVDPEKHESSYLELCLYMKLTYAIAIDISGSDVSRACFMSWHPDLYYNPDSEVYTLKGLIPPKTERKPFVDGQSKVNASTEAHALAVVERIEAAAVNICGQPGDGDDYKRRLLIRFSLTTLGEAGRDLTHRVFKFYDKYDPTEIDDKYSENARNTRFTNPAYFFRVAKDHGIDVSRPDTKPKPVKEKPSTIKPVSKPADNQKETGTKVEKPKKIDYLKFGKVHYKEGGMWVWGTKNWIEIGDNFQLFVKYCTEDDNDEKTWILEIIRDENSQPLYIEVTHEEFCSATKLKNKLAGYRLSLKLTDTYLGELWTALFSMDFPMATKVMRFGYHPSGVFFFANKAVNGKVLDPDEFGIVTATDRKQQPICLSMPQLKKNRVHHFTLTPGQMTFTEWFGYLADAHKYENAFLPACFYLMALFRDLVVNHTKASPILYLKGGASTGKSSIVRSISTLYGYEQPGINLKNKNTEAALVRKMSQASNGVIWMDEYHNEFPYEGLLQAAYDNDGYHRASEGNGIETDSVDIYSALVLTSNYIPENPIFFSRCVFIPITDQQKTQTQIDAFNKLRDIEKAGFGCVTVEMLAHRALIEAEFLIGYTDLYTHLKTAVKHEKIVERLISNMARVMTPAYILQGHGKIAMMEFGDPDDILQEFVQIGTRMILRQHQIQTEKTALSEFFEILQNQYEQGFLVEDTHFRLDGDKLHLRFPSLYTIYAQRYRQTFWKAPADRDTLKSEMIGFEVPEAPDDFFRNIRFMPDESDTSDNRTRSISGCCTMTYSKLQQGFGLDLLARKVNQKD